MKIKMDDHLTAVLYFLLGDNLKADFTPIVEEDLGIKINEKISISQLEKINWLTMELLIEKIAKIFNTDIKSIFYYTMSNGIFISDEYNRYEDMIPKPYIITDGAKSNYFFIDLLTEKYKDSLKIKWKYENFDLESIYISNDKKDKHITYYKKDNEWYIYKNKNIKKIKYTKKGDYIYFEKIEFINDYNIMFIYKKQRNDKQDYINYKCLCSDTYGWINESLNVFVDEGICWFVSIMMILLLHPDMRKITLEKLQKKSKMEVSKLFACKETKTPKERLNFFYNILSDLKDKTFGNYNYGGLKEIIDIVIPKINKIIPQAFFTMVYQNNTTYINEIQNKINPNRELFVLIIEKNPFDIVNIYENIKGYRLMGIGTQPIEKIDERAIDLPFDYDYHDNSIMPHQVSIIRCEDDNWYLYDDNRDYAMDRIETTIENNIITFKRQKYFLCEKNECRMIDRIITIQFILYYLKV